jgi:hypothetical protein
MQSCSKKGVNVSASMMVTFSQKMNRTYPLSKSLLKNSAAVSAKK